MTMGRSAVFCEFMGVYVFTVLQACLQYFRPMIGLWCCVLEALYFSVLVCVRGDVAAHLNPAISVAMVLARRVPPSTLPQYVTAQIAGAMLARLTPGILLDAGSSTQMVGATSAVRPWWATVAIESMSVLVLALSFLVLNKPMVFQRKYAVSKPSSIPLEQRGAFAVGVGLAYIVVSLACAALRSPGHLNPALLIATALWSPPTHFAREQLPLLLLAQVAGAGMAVSVLRATHPEEYDERYALEEGLDLEELDGSRGPPLPTRLSREFVGMFAITFVVCACSTATQAQRAVAYSGAFGVVGLTLSDRTGGFYNPCCTLGASLFGFRAIPVAAAVQGVLLQGLAAVFAAILYSAVTAGGSPALDPPHQGPLWKACMAEAGISALLSCISITMVLAQPSTGLKSRSHCAAFSLCLLLGCLAFAGVSGGWFNPAVTLGAGLSQLLNRGTCVGLFQYLLSQVSGSFTALFVLSAALRQPMKLCF